MKKQNEIKVFEDKTNVALTGNRLPVLRGSKLNIVCLLEKVRSVWDDEQ